MQDYVGVILAGGSGTRLHPATKTTNKHLIPILNHQMVLYPLRTLKSLGIKRILLVTGGDPVGGFAEFLGDGSEYGVDITYKVQKEAGGIAEALGLAEDFCKGRPLAVVLGDNIFGLNETTVKNIEPPPYAYDSLGKLEHATMVVKKMKGASRFGVLMFKDGRYKIVEKPKNVEEGDVVTGLYIYPNDVFRYIKKLEPSDRGELEITDINNYYIRGSGYRVIYLGEDEFWSDAGTRESLARVSKWAVDNYPKI